MDDWRTMAGVVVVKRGGPAPEITGKSLMDFAQSETFARLAEKKRVQILEGLLKFLDDLDAEFREGNDG